VIVVVPDETDDLLLREAFIGDAFAEQFPDDDPKTVNISKLINLLLVADDLGCHPLEGPQSIGVMLLTALLLLPGESEVAELDLPVLPHEHVGGLEVAVQDLLHIVEVDHALDDGKQHLRLLFRVEALPLLVELVEERPVLEVLCDERVLVGGYAHPHVEDDVGVLQITDDLQLLHEVFLVTVLPRLQVVLYCDQLAHVLTLIDLPESALADQL
jgi:hypothetical protein